MLKAIVSASLAAALLGAATPTPDPYRVPSDCARYFPKNVCQGGPYIGRWLPRFGVAWQVEREGQATRTSVHDYFVYGPPPKSPLGLFAGGPNDGTYFTYGMAGPPKGHVIYDRRHKIAFYHEGCCSWGSTVAASGVEPPPKYVADRDLSSLHTKYGIRLGDSPAQVKRVYGGATLWDVVGHPGFRRLVYTAPLPPVLPSTYTGCGMTYQFVFNGGSLIFIELLGGC